MSVGTLKFNENIQGEENDWGTGVVCPYSGCGAEIRCWIRIVPRSRPYYNYICSKCGLAGSWYELAKRLKK